MESAISQERIVIFGWGSQGSAQGLNLRDSGARLSVCLRPESPRAKAVAEAGIPLLTDAKAAARGAGVAVLLIPDLDQPGLYNDTLRENLPEGAALLFAHGFNIHYGRLLPRPDLDVVLVAPMATGEELREAFRMGSGAPAIIAVAQDATGRARERALGYARCISRGGPFIASTFAEETETDLFAEQAVSCGGVPELVRTAFESLVEAGYNPEIAYFCCLKELVGLARLMERYGIAGMRARISEAARYGALTRGRRVAGEAVRGALREILEEIRDGRFARELLDDPEGARMEILKLTERDGIHPIEAARERTCPKGR